MTPDDLTALCSACHDAATEIRQAMRRYGCDIWLVMEAVTDILKGGKQCFNRIDIKQGGTVWSPHAQRSSQHRQGLSSRTPTQGVAVQRQPTGDCCGQNRTRTPQVQCFPVDRRPRASDHPRDCFPRLHRSCRSHDQGWRPRSRRIRGLQRRSRWLRSRPLRRGRGEAFHDDSVHGSGRHRQESSASDAGFVRRLDGFLCRRSGRRTRGLAIAEIVG